MHDNPLVRILIYTAPFVFIGFLGVFTGVVFKRWGQFGMYVMWLGLGVLLAVAAVLVTWRGWWPAVGRFFVEQPAVAPLAGYPLALAVLMVGAGYLTLRRATP